VQPVGAGPARDFARRARSYREWCGWGGVGADLIRESRRWFRLSRIRSVPTGEEYRATCRSGPCPRFRAQGALLHGMAWVGQRRSGSYPRIAPVVPAIADKVRSYGGRNTVQPVGAGPARDFARRARSYMEWCGWGGVGADLIRESRRWFRLSRTRSAPTGEEYRATCRSGPCPRNRAQGALLHGMVRVGRRRSGPYPRIAPVVPAIADKVRSYGGRNTVQPVGAGPARDSRAGRAPTWNGAAAA